MSVSMLRYRGYQVAGSRGSRGSRGSGESGGSGGSRGSRGSGGSGGSRGRQGSGGSRGSGRSGMSVTIAATRLTRNLLAAITGETEAMAQRTPAQEEERFLVVVVSGRVWAPGVAMAATNASIKFAVPRRRGKPNSLSGESAFLAAGELLAPFASPCFAYEAFLFVPPHSSSQSSV